MFFVKNLSLLLTVFVCFSCAKHGVVDESGKVISEEEIAREKKSKNTVIYTLGGGVLSFGVGVFASSFVYRGDKKFKLVNPISIGTGVVGTSILFFQGKNRDRMLAIERIKDQRKMAAEKELEEKRERRTRLKKEIEEMQKEKARLEDEKRKLKEKMEKESNE